VHQVGRDDTRNSLKDCRIGIGKYIFPIFDNSKTDPDRKTKKSSINKICKAGLANKIKNNKDF